jgi:hypothetical protein
MSEQRFSTAEEIEGFITYCAKASPSILLSRDKSHTRAEDQRLVLTVNCGPDVVEQGHIGLGPVTWHTLYLMKSAIENAYKAGFHMGLEAAAERLHEANCKIIGVK